MLEILKNIFLNINNYLKKIILIVINQKIRNILIKTEEK